MTEDRNRKTQIDIALILPSVGDPHDGCVQHLIELLRVKEGIDAAHTLATNETQLGRVCIHFNPDKISLSTLREFTKRVGAKLEQHYGYLLIHIKPMHARQASTLETRLRKIAGVLESAVSVTGAVRIEFDKDVSTEEKIRSEMHNIGIDSVKKYLKDPIEPTPRGKRVNSGEIKQAHILSGEKAELVFTAVCGMLLGIGWLISLTNTSTWLSAAAYIAAYLFGGFFTFREAVTSLRERRFEIDFLMLIAAIGAATLGKWFEGALLLFLFSLGHALEHYAMGRAKRAIEALANIAPQTAIVRKNGRIREVAVEQLRVGDVVIIKPHERIPADGFVTNGESSVDQSPITGESVPVDKQAVDDLQRSSENINRLDSRYRVFAGTINGSGALEVQVTKISSESTLARVVKMVSEAETQKSPTQRFTDRFEHYFVPAALAFTLSLLFVWVIVDEPFSKSFYRAMAVLVAASPCALAIATPSAVLSGVARAARAGVLIKGGRPLEVLGRLDAIAFDKTGTLTEGKPQLTDVVGYGNVTDQEILRNAVAIERLSDHPLAGAVVDGSKDRLKDIAIPDAKGVTGVTGRGVKGIVEGQPVYLGNESLYAEIEGPAIPEQLRKSIENLKAAGRTTMVVRRGEDYLGALGLMDTPRNAAKNMIDQLRRLGIRRIIMLSGDNQQVATAVANSVGISEAWGDLLPEDKVDAVKKLNEQRGVAMVGDGVNDAPAMASAAVGIAMGTAGSDVALEIADVALMADDLNHLPFAIGLSRQTSRIIRQNLWFSLGMVAFLIPATIAGLQIAAAVVFHEGSTLLVVGNALRLLAYRKK